MTTTGTAVQLYIPPADTLPDNDQYVNRFHIRSSSSNRLYVIAQNRAKRHWCCSCPSWRTRRYCQHLAQLQLPAYEKPHEVLVGER